MRLAWLVAAALVLLGCRSSAPPRTSPKLRSMPAVAFPGRSSMTLTWCQPDELDTNFVYAVYGMSEVTGCWHPMFTLPPTARSVTLPVTGAFGFYTLSASNGLGEVFFSFGPCVVIPSR